jgi:hypothetical protein
MNKLFEVIYWLKIFLSPFLFLNVLGVALFLYNKDFFWIWVSMGTIGLILGIFWAEKVRINEGTTQFMGGIYKTDDIKSFDEIINKDDDITGIESKSNFTE